MAYARKDYLGTRADTTLNGGINNSTTSITITSATGWPSVSNTGFYAVIDPDVDGSEEKVFVTARTGTGLTVTRGVDGTTAVSHATGATIRPTFSGVDADEANYMVAQTVGKVATAGQMLKASAANTFTTLDKGSNSTVLAVSSGGTLGYATVTDAMVASSAAVPLSKLAAMSTGYLVGNNSGSTAAPSAVSISSLDSTLSGGYTTKTETGDGTRDSGTYDSGELSFFASAVDRPYAFEGVVVYSGVSGSPNLYFKVQTVASPSVTAYGVTRVIYVYTSGGASIATLSLLESAGTTGVALVSTTKRCLRFSGWGVQVDDAYGFPVSLAQEYTDAAHPITIHAGSYMRYKALT